MFEQNIIEFCRRSSLKLDKKNYLKLLFVKYVPFTYSKTAYSLGIVLEPSY